MQVQEEPQPYAGLAGFPGRPVRFRHPVRFPRLRDDLTVQQVPPFGT